MAALVAELHRGPVVIGSSLQTTDNRQHLIKVRKNTSHIAEFAVYTRGVFLLIDANQCVVELVEVPA